MKRARRLFPVPVECECDEVVTECDPWLAVVTMCCGCVQRVVMMKVKKKAMGAPHNNQNNPKRGVVVLRRLAGQGLQRRRGRWVKIILCIAVSQPWWRRLDDTMQVCRCRVETMGGADVEGRGGI